MPKPSTKKEESVVEVCIACNGTGRGPLEGLKETTCSVCKGTGK